ncbi:hypothetical protein GFK91_31295 (plasmid) [Roseibium aggregatum]|uniref:hypothetical protein n=1 Tax=Roseibium aggregatum TaxID=187304 RepID=UPI001E30817E|nr:hypothetical protein [Roseibium aggregatum]UES60207.1 hypothetical protein GFK91_31295 [Roseibium aggregatum]
MYTLDDLKIVMRHYAAAISKAPNDTYKDISEDVIHKNALPVGGIATATPRRLYKSAVRYALNVNGHSDKTWPANWLDLSIAQLAPKII